MIGDFTRAGQAEPPIISLSTSLLCNFNNELTGGLDPGMLFQKRREHIHEGSVATSLLLTF
jgi:hypothetical protein